MYSQRISREKLYQKFSDNFMNIPNVISAHDVLVDHCYTTTSGWCYDRINCQQSGLSQTIQPPVCTSLEKVAIIVMCMGNWTRLTDIVVCEEEWQYRYHWLRVQAEVGSSEYQTNSTNSTRHQSSKLGLWSPVFKAEQLIRNFTELQCASCNMSPGTRYWMEWWKNSTVSGDAISAA